MKQEQITISMYSGETGIMKIIKQSSIAFLILLFTFAANAQSKKSPTSNADKAFEKELYAQAVKLYEKAYTKSKNNKPLKAEISFKIAMCYKYMNNTKKAESWFRKAIQTKYPDNIVRLYFADMLKVNGKYDEAITMYKEYKDLVPSDKLAKTGIESCELSKKWLQNPTRYKVENIRKFNSKQSDFAPSFADAKYNSIIFTSSRVENKGRGNDGWTGEKFSDLYVTYRDPKKGTWTTPVALGDTINTAVNEGASSLTSTGMLLYFTRCKIEKKKLCGCEVFVSHRDAKDWGETSKLSLGPDSLINAHPSISANELELYFVSNMPGGYGGKDIWVIKRDKKNKPWSKPINLGADVNTEFDEVFPFIRPDGILYFSSNRPDGMGGLDIYEVKKKDETNWGVPENMKYPINTSFDDFSIAWGKSNPPKGAFDMGYFSSNRAGTGGRGSDDIYSFVLPPKIFTLKGVVRDKTTKAIIAGAKVRLVGTDGLPIETKTDAKGVYSFDKTQISPNVTYDIFVSKEKYFATTGKETTVGLENSKDFIHDFVLEPIPQKPIELPEILYDLAKWDLKPQYQDSLNGLIQTLNDNPTIVIELSSHTDPRASDEYNDTLSQKRAQSVVDYLISKGIDPDRVVAKGYGKRVPKVLEKDITRDGFLFPKGTILNEAYINSIKNPVQKEAAYQMNRRTEFKVLRDNFIPKPTNTPVIHPKDTPKEQPKDTPKEQPKESPKDPKNEQPKDIPKDIPKDKTKEEPKK
jgi:peptidoglycan-associated lipoprotein